MQQCGPLSGARDERGGAHKQEDAAFGWSGDSHQSTLPPERYLSIVALVQMNRAAGARSNPRRIRSARLVPQKSPGAFRLHGSCS